MQHANNLASFSDIEKHTIFIAKNYDKLQMVVPIAHVNNSSHQNIPLNCISLGVEASFSYLLEVRLLEDAEKDRHITRARPGV